jgi:hypothetical protein
MESRSTLIFFTIYTLVVFLLYLLNQQSWTAKNYKLTGELDTLKQKLSSYQDQIQQLGQKDSLQKADLAQQKFDGFDSQGFRVYGLLRDEEKRFTVESAAAKFNIFPPSSVKFSDVLGERWFIVPVKGLHWVESGETAGKIASYYYTRAADSVLILSFNPSLKAGKYIFIPFDKALP